MGLTYSASRSWCVSTDPEFASKSADIIGLYLGPPANAVVLSVDEKPCIQALEREQGWLKMPDGKSLTGFAHEYKRKGTTHLFAALNVATGQVAANCFPGKRSNRRLLISRERRSSVDNRPFQVIAGYMKMDRTAFKQQSFLQAADHQSIYRNAPRQEQAENFKYLMSVAFGFVGKPWPKMEKQLFSSSKRP